MQRACALVLVLAACAAGAIVPFASAIYDMQPTRVGMDGYARITISGKGFYRDGVDGATTVYLGSQICNTIEYYSSDTQIVCETPAFDLPVRAVFN
jgi:hypothetical protein